MHQWQVWRKSVNRYWRYRGNIKLPRESRTDGRTDSGTDGRPENIASAGAYRRRRLKKTKISAYTRGVVTALKPVQAEQVRWTEWSQVPGQGSVSLILRKTSSVRSKKPAQAEQMWPESRHRRPRVSSPFIFFSFLYFLAISFKCIFFIFFGRWSPVWELVPSYRSPRPWHLPRCTVWVCGSSSHLWPLSWRGANPIKLAYNPSWQAPIPASAFDQL